MQQTKPENQEDQVETPQPPRWGVRQRLVFLEACILWNDRLTTNMLVNVFGISRRQAGKDILTYQKIAPDNLEYNPIKRGYIAGKKFKPKYLTGTTQEYLDWILSTSLDSGSLLTLSALSPATEYIRLPAPAVDLDVLKAIVRGIREKKIVMFNHQGNDPYLRQKLAPHTLIHDGNRWFVRAYDNLDFITIDLMGISFAEVTDQSSAVPVYPITINDNTESCAANDKQWQQMVQVAIRINPDADISEVERTHIEQAYRMKDGLLMIEIREALVKQYKALVNHIFWRDDIPLFMAEVMSGA